MAANEKFRPRHGAINYNVPDMAWGSKNGLTGENREGGFRFQYFGSTLQLKIENAADLRRIGELDEAHWVATGAPIAAINADPVFLDLVDTDHDGRIGCSELRQAISWLLEHLEDYAGADAGSTALVCRPIKPVRCFRSSGKNSATCDMQRSSACLTNRRRVLWGRPSVE